MPSQRRQYKYANLALALVLAFGAAPGAASTTPRLNGPQTIAVAAVVVHATAVSSASHWNESHSLVVTDVRFKVQETLKGEASPFISVRIPGGRIGKLLVEVPGMPEFSTGSEAILALVHDHTGALYVAGGGQGRWNVGTDRNTGSKTVHGLPLAPSEPEAAKAKATAQPTAQAPDPQLDAVLHDLRAFIHGTLPGGGR